MSFDPVPWMVAGGAKHSADVGRLLAYAATGGNEGVVDPSDCKVTALGTPSGQVSIAPGAVGIRKRGQAYRSQAYLGRNPTATQVGISATTSAGARSDLVIVRVEDPNTTGATWQAPSDPTSGPYIFPRVLTGVPSTTTTVDALNLGYDAVALARIDIPASTAAITSSMITDLRSLMQPRRQRYLFRFQPTGDQPLNGSTWFWWPTWEPTFLVPPWATHCVALMQAVGIVKSAGGNVIGDLRIEFCVPGNPGTVMGQVVYEEDASSQNRRTSTLVSGELDVTSQQGLVRSIRIGAQRNPTYSATDGLLTAVSASNFVIDVEFEQRPK